MESRTCGTVSCGVSCTFNPKAFLLARGVDEYKFALEVHYPREYSAAQTNSTDCQVRQGGLTFD